MKMEIRYGILVTFLDNIAFIFIFVTITSVKINIWLLSKHNILLLKNILDGYTLKELQQPH